MAPYHRVSSTWHTPVDAISGWEEVRAEVAGGQPVAVAVDNYDLPFRPAYRDVHTNHLVVVYGFDDRRGTVSVIDAVPPRFRGEIMISQLTAARDSRNPVRHERDMFFTAEPISNRWLEVHVAGLAPAAATAAPALAPDADRLRATLAANVAGYAGADDSGPRYSGLPGLRRFMANAAERLEARDQQVVDEAFVVAGVALALAGMHGDFLAAVARRLGLTPVLAIAREVDRIAHHWSAVRIILGHGRQDLAAASQSLASRSSALLADQARVLDRMDRVICKPRS
jgi:hypothetical protein